MPKPSVQEGFKVADGRNLPTVTSMAVAEYFRSATFLAPEMKNVKTARSSRLEYSDEAIGYVQVKRDSSGICHVKAQITPEHRIHNKNYNVHCLIDESKDLVLKAVCDDCAACAGGCKHAVAFVTWLHHKSSEPSVTEKECYWRRSRLSQAGSSKCLPLDQEVAMSVVEISEEEIQDFKKSIADELRGRNVKCMFLSQIDGSSSISIHHLILEFKKNGGDFEEFLNFCQSKMTESECRGVRDSTLSQSASYLWFEYRYGRVTASKLFEASRCTTENGTLVNTILGASKIRDSKAMERGRKLEGIVMKQLERTWGQIAPSGLVLDKEYPIFGASPDGVTNTHVVEIKCPMSDKTFPSYFASGLTKPAPKYEAQIMLQMLFCLKDKAIYSVAHPDFESSGKITTLEVPFDAVLCADLMERAQEFWKKYIFTKLLSQ